VSAPSAHDVVVIGGGVTGAGVARDLARTPLFEVLLTVQNGRAECVELDGVTLSTEPVAAQFRAHAERRSARATARAFFRRVACR